MIKIFKKIKSTNFFWILFYLFFFGLILSYSLSYLDPDFGWHLKVGQEIAQTGAVPHLNNYNYTFTGSWVDHEWLSNFLVYQIYSRFGYLALNVALAALIIIVLFILNLFIRSTVSKNISPVLLMGLEGLGIIASLPHFGVRIQEVALLFLLVLLIIIYFYNKTKDWRLLVALPLCLYVWASLHASFLIGFFIVFAFVFIKLAETVIYRFWRFARWDFSQSLSYREIGLFSASAVLSLGATFFTPYRAELYAFLGGYGNTVYFSYIDEWLSQFSFPFYYWQLAYLALVCLALLIYLYDIYHRRNWKFNVWKFFIVSLFFGLAFKSRRHFPLLFISSLPFLAEIYFVSLRAKKLNKVNIWLSGYLLGCFFLITFSQFLQIKAVSNPFTGFCRDYPCGAVEFLKSKPAYANYNIFNNYGWGGYLIAVYPEKKLFIDGRLPQVNFSGHTFLEEYLEFSKKGGSPASQIAKYDIKLVLLPTSSHNLTAKPWEKFIFGIKDSDLVAVNRFRDYLLISPDWQRVYYDPVASVFIKK